MLCTVSTARPERQDDRQPTPKWGHRLTSACVALASGLAVNQLSSTLGYRGLAGASIAVGIVAGVFWLRALPPRAPLLRYSFRALLLSAFVAVVAAFVVRSTWTVYLAFAAAGLTAMAASLTIDFFISCAVLGGASTVGAGVAIISDGLTLVPRVTSSPVLEPLAQTPEPIVLMAAGALAIGGGVALIVVRDTDRVSPLVRIGIAIAMAGFATIIVGRSSLAEITLVPAGLAIGGFGLATIGVAGLFAWKDIKTPWRVTAICGIAIIAFDLGVHSGRETLTGHVSMIVLGSATFGLGIGLRYVHGKMGGDLSLFAFAAMAASIIGLGVTILIYPSSSLGNAAIGTGVAATAQGVTVLWFIGSFTLMGLFAKEGRARRFLNSLISG